MDFTPVSPLFFFGACCKRGRHFYITTAPSCCIPASYCRLSTILQTMSITVVNLQDNRAVFRIFIALLRFSFDSPSYILVVMFLVFHAPSFFSCCLFLFLYSRRRNLSRSDDSAIREMNWYNMANKYVLDQLSDMIRETSVTGLWR